MQGHQEEVRTYGNGEAVKVVRIGTGVDLENYWNQRGFYPWRASEMVGSVGSNGMRYGLYVSHVADETGEGYVFWLDRSHQGRRIGGYHVHVRATREEALAEARETYERAVRGECAFREDPEWFAEVEA